MSLTKASKRFLVVFFICACFSLYSQTASDRGFAAEEFRRGVQSYYRGAFNEAILQFETALSYLPEEGLILEWLGKSYYKSGIEGAAIQQWKYATELGHGGLLLENKTNAIQDRRLAQGGFDELSRYVEAGSFASKTADGQTTYFSQPTSILPLPDGGAWFVAYGSNELLRMNVNGDITLRIRGPVNGFDRPMDIVRLSDGSLLLSEFAGDRISMLSSAGLYKTSFGTSGLENGNLLGPQYLALDSSENIYVTDFGNGRVAVFNRVGEPLFTFGTKSSSFKGFSAPSGIAIVHDIVYVSDAVYGAIYSFDTAGNYLGVLVPEGTLERPEAMKHWRDVLLLADSNKILAIDTTTGSITEVASAGNAPSRLTCAVSDVNGNIWAADFMMNELLVMAKMSDLVGGLFVQIERVNADAFPEVAVDVRVENRTRQAVTGLGELNFFLTEENNPVLEQTLIGAASQNDRADIAIIIDRSETMTRYADAVDSAVLELASSLEGKGTITLISASNIPVLEFSGSPSYLSKFSSDELQASTSSERAFDQSLRLAANGLINGESKRSVIFITDGSFSQTALHNYGLSDLSAYMNNNGILFSVINVTQNPLPPEINYLVEQTAGHNYYVYRPTGLSTVVQDVLDSPVGLYRFTFTSQRQTNFGESFIPLEVEAYLLNLSGRDETGYFAPLE